MWENEKLFLTKFESCSSVFRLIKYNKEGYARIGVMPRYGDADSIKWFDVETSISFHIFNSFEDGDEVTKYIY